MANYLKLLWQQLSVPGRLSAPDSKAKAEVERIAVLRQTAASRRAELAEEQQQAALAGDGSRPGPLSYSRKRVEEAEAAHALALQTWENKQSGQKSH